MEGCAEQTIIRARKTASEVERKRAYFPKNKTG
jgi:hypothetical protein